MSDLSINPSKVRAQPNRRRLPENWKLWLAICSPLVIAVFAWLYFVYVRSHYLPAAGRAAASFHELLKSGEDDEIYDGADVLWRSRLSRETQHAFFERMAEARKLPVFWPFRADSHV